MTRNLKALGLALIAAFAISAVVASTASAAAAKFRSEASSTILTGKQHAGNDKFVTDGGTVECNEATYVGSQTGTEATEASVTPTYSGCTAFFFINVPIVTNECEYTFTSGEKNAQGNFEGSTHIECPAGKAIEVKASSTCTVTVGTQTPTGGTITYTNVGTGTTREITVDVALTGIHYTEDGSGTGCPHGQATTNGTYNGAALVTGENEEGVHKGIWIE